jgi:molybdopterin converting factor small subunit
VAVRVRLPGMLARYAGGAREVAAEGATAGAALADLARRHPELGSRLLDASGALFPYLHLFRNGERLEGPRAMDAPVAAGDALELLAAASGG